MIGKKPIEYKLNPLKAKTICIKCKKEGCSLNSWQDGLCCSCNKNKFGYCVWCTIGLKKEKDKINCANCGKPFTKFRKHQPFKKTCKNCIMNARHIPLEDRIKYAYPTSLYNFF